MAILKLQQAGESATLKIKSATVAEGKYGPQVRFESESGDLLYISQETAEKQLDRCGLKVATCAGETLTFSRDPNKSGGAPYWGIRVADAVDRAQPSESVRVQSPYQSPTSHTQPVAPTASEKMRIATSYVDLLKFMKAQTGLTDEQALQSAAATVWIAWGQQGLTRAEPKAEAPKPAPKPKAEPDLSKFPPESAADADLPF